ncbi:MAG: class I SAM-dependent methyltransferase [Armatimonadetes bacterium]|nr:class I SAM-dependent methyltransferase [Armatimonadota bacterium]MDW8121377.1 methyltransferase domain-containing protein [Armatimonadota bacterium]
MELLADRKEERFRQIFGTGDYPEAPEFTILAPYYDQLMRDVPYRSWVQYVDDLLYKVDPNFRYQTVLELACGTGTLSLEYAKKGCRVVGIDISQPMIDIARNKARSMGLSERTFFTAADAAAFDPSALGPFDLTICLFDSLNYIIDPNALQQVFQNTRPALKKGGYFIFDLNSEYSLAAHLFDQDNLWRKNAPLYYYWKSHYDPTTKLCRIDMWFAVNTGTDKSRCFKEVHWQRAYTIDEIRWMADKAGWQWIKVLEAYTFKKPEPESERWYFVLQNP